VLLRLKNTTPLCFYLLQGRVILAEEKIRFESKGEGEVVRLTWAREHEGVWGLHEFLSFAVNGGDYVLGEFIFSVLL
jgi:hypothetical protein